MENKDQNAIDQEKRFKLGFENYFPELCHFASAFVRDVDLSQDIVQETFVKLWDIKEQFSDNQSLRAWLYTATRYKCLDYLKSKRHKDKFRTQTLELITKEAPPEFSELEREEIMHTVNLVLDELSETTRKIFNMSRQEGLSYLEIAEKCGLSVKSVESHMSKALKALRISMKDYLFLAYFLYF